MPNRRARSPGFATEADMARVVIAWLRADAWEVYQEVECGDVADIVATRGGEVAVVECKLALNLDVLYQALRWKPRAHYAWAAAPAPRRNHEAWQFAASACRALGLGLLEVYAPGQRYGDRPAVEVRVAAAHQPHGAAKLLATLRPEHKTYAVAGSPTGHRWTPFRETERNLAAYVLEHPGLLAREALKAIKHHWRQKYPATRCIALIGTGVLKGVRVDHDGRLYPDEPTSAERLAAAEQALLAAVAREADHEELGAFAAAYDALALPIS